MESPIHQIFQSSVDMEHTYWESIFQMHMPELKKKLCTQVTTSICPLQDLGDFVLQKFHLLFYFLEQIAEEKIQERTRSLMQHLADTDDGSGTLYLEERAKALRSILNHLKFTAELCQDVWAKAPLPSQHAPTGFVETQSVTTHPFLHSSAFPLTTRHVVEKVEQDQTMHDDEDEHEFNSGINLGMRSIPEEGEMEMDEREDSEDLTETGSECFGEDPYTPTENGPATTTGRGSRKPRGKSFENVCSYGKNCRFGGYDPQTGKFKVFLRNCKFNEHMARHNKPFVCTINGCGKGFPRKAGLERHQQNVTAHRTGQPPTTKFIQTQGQH
ncbi:hypothetical protein GQ43DRAFT_460923 [Delitschia confertaspora ATCC 74209]|uniref:C2H2-type domain-containing protein n=1 Tax=Delitschia confertaspora ATCC 74209 TaxID=1513339 RepID=A0A9P4JR75_9PLEO|nr:hypothetical protein GQ43DRAFT_460923 [Delitschia confertaspora ATCC 74209]